MKPSPTAQADGAVHQVVRSIGGESIRRRSGAIVVVLHGDVLRFFIGSFSTLRRFLLYMRR